jgi:hypothetical protein
LRIEGKAEEAERERDEVGILKLGSESMNFGAKMSQT